MQRRRRIRTVAGFGALGAGLAAAALAAPPTSAAPPGSAAPARPTYTNEVTRGYSIDFPDPAVIRGKDGNWYAYATGGPYDEQGKAGSSYKIAKSADLVHWENAGDIFPAGRRPSWATATTGFWAPDIRYVNGTYLLYFTVPDTTTSTQGFDPAIGVATAPTPAGPWTPSDAPLIPARPVGTGYDTVIDPALFTDTDGTLYLYYGGYGSGIWVVKLSPDGRRAVTEPRHVASSRYEGPYLMHKDGWYYLFASSANCCAGPTTGYTVFAGRSRSPLGPFVDRLGVPLLASRAGGTPVIAPNGNKWIGTGHHSAALDVSGQTYMAYHAIDRDDPWLDVSPGFTMRPMNLDRLDWIDGWPIVRAGLGASDDPQPAPIVRGEVDDRFENADATAANFSTLTGDFAVAGPDDASDSGGFARLSGNDALAVTKKVLSDADVRVEADVRTTASGSVGVGARYVDQRTGVRAILDAGKRELRLEASLGSNVRTRSVPLPAGYDVSARHVLALEARGTKVTANLTDARLGDPWAEVSLEVPNGLDRPGRAGLLAEGSGEADNFSVNPLFTPVTKAVPAPKPGKVDPAYSDEFTGGLGAGWSWLREDANAQVKDGQLVWPTQTADLVGDGKPGLLLRGAMPEGDYTVETKLSIDLGVDAVRNYQQGGLIVYNNDDDFLRYDVVAVGPTRIAEFGKETVFQGRRSWGGGLVGAPAETTWLRLVHTRDPKTGEHRFRAASSTDGENWTWGLTWTLPANSTPKVGLVSHGSQPATTEKFGPALSEFEYFRVSRP
ncbi:family 43 glycosylhydrolase [Actinopolymorpha alba]|uniref:family 43 glycosylhydrolase n=1 Tax=Actinopolymorpha alba TaxID=533267 RepID=UPI0003812B8D|nr:family 43 glycosylhydrolase [Actinopolymorpha alba]